jgi:GDPmannose 4,6-dehydratase
LEFKGEGVNEVGTVSEVNTGLFFAKTGLSAAPDTLNTGAVVVKIDPRYFRPTEVDLLIGDPTKAKTKLGWTPQYDLNTLVQEMVAADVKLFQGK